MRFFRMVAGVVLACVVLGVFVPDAHAVDTGSPLHLVSFTQVPPAAGTWPYNVCTYGENHLWDSSPGWLTMASGTTSKIGGACEVQVPAASVAVSHWIAKWVFGTVVTCIGTERGPYTRYGVSAVSSFDWPQYAAPPAAGPCGHATYTTGSAHLQRNAYLGSCGGLGCQENGGIIFGANRTW